jgi:hypothetical protein
MTDQPPAQNSGGTDESPSETDVGGRSPARLVLGASALSLLGLFAVAAVVRGVLSGSRGDWLVGSAAVLALVAMTPRLALRLAEHLTRRRTPTRGMRTRSSPRARRGRRAGTRSPRPR